MSIVTIDNTQLVDELLYTLQDDFFGRFALNMINPAQLNEREIVEYFVIDALFNERDDIEKQLRQELRNKFSNLMKQAVEQILTKQSIAK